MRAAIDLRFRCTSSFRMFMKCDVSSERRERAVVGVRKSAETETARNHADTFNVLSVNKFEVLAK